MEKNGRANSPHIPKHVALVYDRVNKWGGAERVIIALRKIFPDSVLYTSVYEKSRALWAKKIPIIPSFLQKIPFARRFHEGFAVLMPIAFEAFNFDEYDLVISVTSEAGKGIITKPGTVHLSLCLTPTRYLWSGYEDYFPNWFLRVLSAPFVSYLRFWDKIAAHRPDKMIAISENVRKRIKKYYGLDSEVIYPPLMIRASSAHGLPHVANDAQFHGVEKSKSLSRSSLSERKHIMLERNSKVNHGLAFNSFASGQTVRRSDFYLVVSRLVPYKRVDLVVRAANKVRIPLKIIGTGSELARLEKMAGPAIEFLGYVSDSDLKYYYANCRALIFPGIEDFGLVMVEAQAFGKPVVAFRGGGAEEIIIEGKTGVFFDNLTPASLASVLKRFRPSRYNTKECKKNARRFSYEQFEKQIITLINE